MGIFLAVMLVFSSVSTAAYAEPLDIEVAEELIAEEEAEVVDEAGAEELELAIEEADESEKAVTV